MRTKLAHPWIVALVALAAGAPSGSAAQTPTPGTTQHPPRIHTDLAPVTEVLWKQDLTFRVEASDPEGGRVSLTLLNPPLGLVFDPVRWERSPAVATGHWRVEYGAISRGTLVFEARDESGLSTRLERSIETRAAGRTAVLTGDVTGDGVLDVVGLAEFADAGRVPNAGAIYMWAGASAPQGAPSATLRVPGPTWNEGLGSYNTVKLADVTGDGILDVVALAAQGASGGARDGAVYVFRGGAALTGTPLPPPAATLTAPGARTLGYETGDGFQFADVTHDGVLDVVVSARVATVGGVVGAGAVYFYTGGADMQGVRAPSAVLSLPGAAANDKLCHTDGQGLLIGDVTGDGAPDIIAGSPRADVAGVPDVGAIGVWAGGGIPTAVPSVVLSVPRAKPWDMLGTHSPLLPAVRLVDVTGDGVLDVLAGACEADVAGVTNAGAIYVFEGGAHITRAIAPCTRLRAPIPGEWDQIGHSNNGGFVVADITGDGEPEVVVPWYSGRDGAGAVLVFRVRSRAGGPDFLDAPPFASLGLTVPTDRALASAYGGGFYVAEATGDGILDVVTVTPMDMHSSFGAGAVHVFAGGRLSGRVAPIAALTLPDAATLNALDTRGMRFEDVTGDGTPDVIASLRAPGQLVVFAGDRGLRGDLAPFATLTLPDATNHGALQLAAIVDLTGDGALDLVATADDLLTRTETLYVFAGPVTGAAGPSGILTEPPGAPSTGLRTPNLVDVNDDGVLDVVVQADTSRTMVGGRILVSPGGPLGALVPPFQTLTPLLLAEAGGYMKLAATADVTGDGVPDLLGVAWNADPDGVEDAGALFLFPCGASATAPTVLAVPGACADDRLGYSW